MTHAKGTVRFIGASGPGRPSVGGGFGIARISPDLSGDGFVSDGVDLAVLDAGYRFWRIWTDFRAFGDIGNDDVLVKIRATTPPSP